MKISVLIAGICFAAALLMQVGLARLGHFGTVGSGFLVITALFLPVVLAAGLAKTWMPSRKTARQNPGSISGAGLICALVAVAASVVYGVRWMRPTENLMGGYDESIYAITAANLAKTGHYRLHASLLPTLPGELRPWVVAQFPRMANRTAEPPQRYPCYQACLFIDDEENGTLVSQFPVGFPALLGSAHALFGFGGQRFVNPLLLFTTACVAALLMTSWFGVVAGTATFVVWLWFPVHVWAGNTRFAELLLQLLWLLTLLGIAERTRQAAWAGVLAGVALGVSLAVKIDAIPVVAATALVVAFATYRSELIFLRNFLAALLASTAVSAAALWHDNGAYVLDTLCSIATTNRGPVLYAGAAVAAGCLAWFALRHSELLIKFRGRWPVWQPRLIGVAIAAGFGLAAYAYFFRSHPAEPDSFYYWPVSRVIRSYREDTFFRLGWYWQPYGLALAVIGIGAATRRSRTAWQWLAIGIGLLYLVAFAYDIRNNPKQPYALRRFLPYAIPLMLVGAAAVAEWLPAKWIRVRPWLTTIACLALMAGFWPINERINGKAEYPDLIRQVEVLAERIPDGAVTVVSDRESLTRLASCLEFVHGKPCLVLRGQPRAYGPALRNACDTWIDQGRDVYILSANPGETLSMPGTTTFPAERGVIRSRVVQSSEKSLVTKQSPVTMPYHLNRVERSSSTSTPAAPNRSP